MSELKVKQEEGRDELSKPWFQHTPYERTCIWCGKKLPWKGADEDNRTLCCFYSFMDRLSPEDQVGSFAGGRFCSWSCLKEWIDWRQHKE